VNAFDPGYKSQPTPIKKQPTIKRRPNAFDTDDHKARQACVHLPKTHPDSRADVIRRGNSKM
jgi:hypothetical protein